MRPLDIRGHGLSPWFFYTAAPATIRGAEVQITADPVEGLTLNYSLGYNRLKSKTSDPKANGYIDDSVRQQPDLTIRPRAHRGCPGWNPWHAA